MADLSERQIRGLEARHEDLAQSVVDAVNRLRSANQEIQWKDQEIASKNQEIERLNMGIAERDQLNLTMNGDENLPARPRAEVNGTVSVDELWMTVMHSGIKSLTI